jgi:hypothetical protein
MSMSTLLVVTAVGEALTGLVLLVYPSIVIWLLFGAEIFDVGVVMSRIAGISLIALGLACWPVGALDGALRGMCTYSAVVTVYLGYVAMSRESVGVLLWPAIITHGVVMVLLGRMWLADNARVH